MRLVYFYYKKHLKSKHCVNQSENICWCNDSYKIDVDDKQIKCSIQGGEKESCIAFLTLRRITAMLNGAKLQKVYKANQSKAKQSKAMSTF
jgi:hypothetical protein